MNCLPFLLGLIAVTVRAQFMDRWNAPYTDDSFNRKVEYGDNVTLECNDTRIPSAVSYDYWVLPNLRILKPGEDVSFQTLDGTAGCYVSADGKELTAYLLQEEQFGFYYCAVHKPGPPDENYIVKKAINMHGPFFGDLWNKYRLNVIVGGSAAGGFLLFAILASVVYHFRYKGDEEDKTLGQMTSGSITDPGMTIASPDSDTYENYDVSKRNGQVETYNLASYPQSKMGVINEGYSETTGSKSTTEKSTYDPIAM